MFKKSFVCKEKNFVGQKERQRIQTNFLKQISHYDGSSHFEALFPAKEEMKSVKLQGSKLIVFTGKADTPLLVENNGFFIPTVYALWSKPDLLPCLVVPSEVSEFIFKGAHLMLPGVIFPPSGMYSRPFVAGELWAIRVYQNKYPFAVGSCCMNLTKRPGPSMKGRCLEVYHHFGDYLWKMGPKTTPHESFTVRFISSINDEEEEGFSPFPLGGAKRPTKEDGWWSDEDFPALEEENSATAKASGITADSAHTQLTSSPSKEEHEAQELKAAATEAKLLPVNKNEEEMSPSAPTSAAPPAVYTTKEMDELLEFCLLEVLHCRINDCSLPFDSSSLYSKILLESPHLARTPELLKRFKAVGMTDEALERLQKLDLKSLQADIKLSSYKKAGNFIQFYSNKKLLHTNLIRGIVVLVKVNRSHPMYISHKPVHIDKNVLGSAISEDGKPVKKNAADVSTSKEPLTVLEFYTPSARLQTIFAATGTVVNKKSTFTYAECADVLSTYLKYILPENVPQDRTGSYNLDSLLYAALISSKMKNSNKKQDSTPLRKSEAELFTLFDSYLTPLYAVSRPSIDLAVEPLNIIKGVCPPVEITTEKRAMKKMVTRIEGLETFYVTPDAVAEYLQKKLASAACTQLVPGSSKRYCVIIQGKMVAQSVEALVQQFGIPKKYINQTAGS